MAEKIIGRENEIEELKKYINSDKSEFIAVYGRRRVGKTFLIRNTFKNKFSFYVTGTHGVSKQIQLTNFAYSLKEYSKTPDLTIPKNWLMAFQELKDYLSRLRKGPKIIFFDELPWMETPKSGFVSALEHFWNSWASQRDDIKLIVCGSATSWIISKIIRNRGGLHNRVTHKMLVNPFRLKECEEYFKSYGFKFSKRQIAECYMILGGIPYYLSLMDKSLSLPQNIDMLLFNNNAKLKDEFNVIYDSLFKNPEAYVEIVSAMARKGKGMTRAELIKEAKLQDNGNVSLMLEELELCGFIRRYTPFESKSRKSRGVRIQRRSLFQLIDFFTLFYFKFLKNRKSDNENFWVSIGNSPSINTWRGITFEKLCLYHAPEIKMSLGIEGVQTHLCCWQSQGVEPGAQIDMLIDRNDDAVNICEMKYSGIAFKIDKKYYNNLQNKVEVFRNETGTRKAFIMTFITTEGVALNEYSDIVQQQVLLDQLFR